MSLAKRIWDSFTGVNLAQRQEDSTTIPAQCFDDCNNAALEAQSTGKNTSICKANSPFQHALSNCQECLNTSTEEGNSTSCDNGYDSIRGEFEQFLRFCEGRTNTTKAQKVVELLSSKSLLDCSLALLTGTGAETMTTTPMTTTTSDSPGMITVTAIPSSSASSSPNVDVIAPSVVVPVVGVVAAIVVAALFIRRRKRQRRQQTPADNAGVNSDNKSGLFGKPELPANSFRTELEGTKPAELPKAKPGVIAELPAREVVGSELDARVS